MDLYEYQARDLFEKYGVPVLPGIVADTPEAVRAAAEELGGVVVVKAQVKTGGRGKAGGVKVAKNPDEAEEAAKAILGLDIKGHVVKRVMVAGGARIAQEFYFSVLLDRANRSYLSLTSVEGGMEIEVLAVEKPEALARVEVDPITGITPTTAREIAVAANFPADLVDKVADVFVKLYDVYKSEDATLVEVNPLILDEDGNIIALDGKVTLDENAEFRHAGHALLEDKAAADPLEAQAKALDLNYVKLDGEVGIIGNGAGLVMSTLDVVAYAGENHGGVKPANFLDIGGGASAEVMANGLGIILGDPQVKSVFVNVFGGITACDQVAKGIVGALAELGSHREQAARRSPRRQQRRRGPPHPRGGGAPARHPRRQHGPGRRQGRRAGERRVEKDSRAMTIFLNKDSKVIVQGITGGEGSKHTARMLAAGSQVVGGVNARKAGTTVLHTDKDGNAVELPVFASVAEAIEQTGADVSIAFVPPAFTKDAVIEAIDAEIPLLVIITEGVPVQDSAEFWAYAKEQGDKTRIIGPNCPGIISPGESLVGITPANITGKGPIGLVSKSGTLTYQMMYELRDLGFSTAIGIGGDPIIGTTHIDALAAFEADPETKAIVMIGEIGGDAEERAADFIKANVTKPVVGYVAGFTAPEGKTMGHAGAIVSGSAGTAQAKKEALEAAGVKVGKTPSETASLLREVYAALGA